MYSTSPSVLSSANLINKQKYSLKNSGDITFSWFKVQSRIFLQKNWISNRNNDLSFITQQGVSAGPYLFQFLIFLAGKKSHFTLFLTQQVLSIKIRKAGQPEYIFQRPIRADSTISLIK